MSNTSRLISNLKAVVLTDGESEPFGGSWGGPLPKPYLVNFCSHLVLAPEENGGSIRGFLNSTQPTFIQTLRCRAIGELEFNEHPRASDRIPRESDAFWPQYRMRMQDDSEIIFVRENSCEPVSVTEFATLEELNAFLEENEHKR